MVIAITLTNGNGNSTGNSSVYLKILGRSLSAFGGSPCLLASKNCEKKLKSEPLGPQNRCSGATGASLRLPERSGRPPDTFSKLKALVISSKTVFLTDFNLKGRPRDLKIRGFALNILQISMARGTLQDVSKSDLRCPR